MWASIEKVVAQMRDRGFVVTETNVMAAYNVCLAGMWVNSERPDPEMVMKELLRVPKVGVTRRLFWNVLESEASKATLDGVLVAMSVVV